MRINSACLRSRDQFIKQVNIKMDKTSWTFCKHKMILVIWKWEFLFLSLKYCKIQKEAPFILESFRYTFCLVLFICLVWPSSINCIYTLHFNMIVLKRKSNQVPKSGIWTWRVHYIKLITRATRRTPTLFSLFLLTHNN